MTETPAAELDAEAAGKYDQWANAVVPELEKVAASYRGYITYGALMDKVIGDYDTKQRPSSWSYWVLNRVVKICKERGLPPLTSLVVAEATGMVGRGFDGLIEDAGQDAPDSILEREQAAAALRLECYRVYCPNVPADAEPQLTREFDEYRADAVRRNKPERTPPPVCPTCPYVLPATGICDNCG